MAPSKPVPKHEDVVIPLEVASDTDVPRRGRKPKLFSEITKKTKKDSKEVAKNVAKRYRIVNKQKEKSFSEINKNAKKDGKKAAKKCYRISYRRKCKGCGKKIVNRKKQKDKHKEVENGTFGRYKNLCYEKKQSKAACKKHQYDDDDEEFEEVLRELREDIGSMDLEEYFAYLENQDDESQSDGTDSQLSLWLDDVVKFQKLNRKFKTKSPKTKRKKKVGKLHKPADALNQ